MTPELTKLIENIDSRRPLIADDQVGECHADIINNHREIYRNRNEKLGIDFSVDVLDFPAVQAFDARVVRVAPGCNNELHKHAHESLFIVMRGEAEVRIGNATIGLKPGEVAFVPRWVFHQSRNVSEAEDLTILALTDFGLTSAVLGDYDKRTRLAANGADAMATGA